MRRWFAANVSLAALALLSCSGPDISENEANARAEAEMMPSKPETLDASASADGKAMAEDDGVATLCAGDETVLFSCRAGSRTFSVCGAADPAEGAQYRANRDGVRELTYPAEEMAPSGTMRRATTGYSGGGEAHIRFDNGGYTYVVYSRTVRTRFDGKGNDPKFTAGVAVIKGDATISDRLCTDPADAVLHSGAAEDYMPAGEFIDIPEKDGQ